MQRARRAGLVDSRRGQAQQLFGGLVRHAGVADAGVADLRERSLYGAHS